MSTNTRTTMRRYYEHSEPLPRLREPEQESHAPRYHDLFFAC